MRTVFVPYVLLSSDHRDQEEQEEQERREAGNEERTVVLCVEVENSGDSGTGVGFRVERIDVNIGGEGARAVLIGWGDRKAGNELFPIHIGSMEQYNLLYAVSFLQNPDDVDRVSLVGGSSNDGEHGMMAKQKGAELQRAVTINIIGKPVEQVGPGDSVKGNIEQVVTETREDTLASKPLSYPTESFASRWNCILDLSPQPHCSPGSSSYGPSTTHIKDVLPEPASPFPMSQSPHTATILNFAQAQERSLAMQMAGSKRHTMPAGVAARAVKPVRGGFKASLTPVHQRDHESSQKTTYTPPSEASFITSPTTYGPPPLVIGGLRSSSGYESHGSLVSQTIQSAGLPPPTPAYPSYPAHSSISPAPNSHMPMSSLQSGVVGPSVEIRRERGIGAEHRSGTVQSPGPMIVGAERGVVVGMPNVFGGEEGEPIVVSVGLLPTRHANSRTVPNTKIYPLHTFALDIFVFNQSTWTRRFEISYPGRRRRHRQTQDTLNGAVVSSGRGDYSLRGSVDKKDLLIGIGDGDKPGILPLENRVRVG
jgi:hypothetical protein